MDITLHFAGQSFRSSLLTGFDISLPVDPGKKGPRCYYGPEPEETAITDGTFIGDLAQGGSVNFKKISLSPHSNGTHTECVGHILQGPYTIHNCLTTFHHLAALLTVAPVSDGEDKIITAALLDKEWKKLSDNKLWSGDNHHFPITALVVRTVPQSEDKKTKDYSGTNPPYFTFDAIEWTKKRGIRHLLTDLPSLDKESDGGALVAHSSFWGLPKEVLTEKTITELVYVDEKIPDALYFCNIQIASLCLDASPSKIILYPLEHL